MTSNTDIGPFFIVPLWVAESVSGGALRLYTILGAEYGTMKGGKAVDAFPSRTTMAGRMACSVDTIDRLIKELEGVGALLKKGRNRDDGSQSSNVYTLVTVRPQSRTNAAPPSRKAAAPGPHQRGTNDPDPITQTQIDPLEEEEEEEEASPISGGKVKTTRQVVDRTSAASAPSKEQPVTALPPVKFGVFPDDIDARYNDGGWAPGILGLCFRALAITKAEHDELLAGYTRSYLRRCYVWTMQEARKSPKGFFLETVRRRMTPPLLEEPKTNRYDLPDPYSQSPDDYDVYMPRPGTEQRHRPPSDEEEREQNHKAATALRALVRS